MHFFPLRNLQHFILYLLPALISVLLFAVGLAYSHFGRKGKQEGLEISDHVFPGGIREANGPFPLVLLLIIAGVVLWGFFYILAIGIMEVRI